MHGIERDRVVPSCSRQLGPGSGGEDPRNLHGRPRNLAGCPVSRGAPRPPWNLACPGTQDTCRGVLGGSLRSYRPSISKTENECRIRMMHPDPRIPQIPRETRDNSPGTRNNRGHRIASAGRGCNAQSRRRASPSQIYYGHLNRELILLAAVIERGEPCLCRIATPQQGHVRAGTRGRTGSPGPAVSSRSCASGNGIATAPTRRRSRAVCST